MQTRSDSFSFGTESFLMKATNWLRAGLPALLTAMLVAAPAVAADAPPINKADTVWMMVATVLVLFMTVPGLALFYGGLVRQKNMLSVLMQVLYTVSVAIVLWVVIGYSLTFTGGSAFIGGFDKAFLAGIAPDSPGGTFSVGVAIPEIVFVMFQATFAGITASLLLGSLVERTKFLAIAIFIPLWLIFVYFPIAHMVWYFAGPDAIDAAAKALAAAPAAGKAAAQAKLDEVMADAGYIFSAGALDFAGTSTRVSQASSARSSSASVSATARTLCLRTRSRWLTSAPRCSGSAGSASTPARTSRRSAPPWWPSSIPLSRPLLRRWRGS